MLGSEARVFQNDSVELLKEIPSYDRGDNNQRSLIMAAMAKHNLGVA
jgi:hypothetical protein